MSNVLVINTTPQETRVALLEDGSIQEFYLERRRRRGVVGNVYKGRVARVLPGMQAAFVEIGLEKAAFLYVNDVYDDHAPTDIDDAEVPDENVEDDPDPKKNGNGRARRRKNATPIEDQLREGQEVLVQVVKDPIGTKGARVTSHITLPGRHLVYMPTVDHLGISRQITSDRERKRLRAIANEMRPPGSGFIVRTASEGVPADKLRRDMHMLVGLWNTILEKREKTRAPALLHEDLDLLLRATRDLATAQLDRLVLDSRIEYDRVMDFVERYMPRFGSRVELYVGREPIFDAYGIEEELQRAVARRVNLPSGGYLIIEKTEALTSIDVNTGGFVGSSSSLEDTISQTNVEAAAEIAYQLRLRNIGGIIIIDFIDMEEKANRDRVLAALESALEGDRGRCKVGKISEFGLVEMTRKRTRESVQQMLCEACPTCAGTGILRSPETLAWDVLRALHRDAASIEQYDIRVRAHPRTIQILEDREKPALRDIELRYNKKIRVHSEWNYPFERFEIAGYTPNPGREGRDNG